MNKIQITKLLQMHAEASRSGTSEGYSLPQIESLLEKWEADLSAFNGAEDVHVYQWGVENDD